MIKSDLMTCPADSNRIWEERGRGSPFFNQFICGGGIPVALHSMFIEVSAKAISFSASSLLPLILGGAMHAEGERLLIQIISTDHYSAFYLK